VQNNILRLVLVDAVSLLGSDELNISAKAPVGPEFSEPVLPVIHDVLDDDAGVVDDAGQVD
jgi:hypothetical protein